MLTTPTPYAQLATTISDYVQTHLDSPINIDDLSAHAEVSKFHLNRVFYATTGFQLGEFIARRRLLAAYHLLAQNGTSVIDVSTAVGYASHSAFSRAFLAAFGCTPFEVKISSTCQWRTPNTIKKLRGVDAALQPEIVTLPTTHYRGLYGAGFKDSSFIDVASKLFEQLAAVLRAANLGKAFIKPIGVSLDNPWLGEEAKSRFFVGVQSANLPTNLALEDYVWQGAGQANVWARFYHHGSYGTMWQTISWVYAGWVVPAQIALRDDAIVQVYLNNPRETAETDLLTALYFPVDIRAPL